ncbi:sigma-70 family RNA polymerase sigma factor [Salegentibacter sp. JZCK2]|uniref:RNA polymerase sigma factor n=1 Tax=Salegentibacter tibetensis TaxID=2873600 RepID=UPI001CC9A119|nr:sigma-70 family RNA polymerase sigma factor [Salegentibacter tibetensis]MBZ9729907.1 sigma-70 family RNA polymerase sigma factor [Salegentibacter tibetensis]
MLQRIFELLQQGHPDALEFIYTKYHRNIFWVGRQILDDDFAVETLVQDTFLILWEKRDRIERPEHIYYFLRMVMKRECCTYCVRPKNKFFKTVNSLESYENYQEYLHGYDPEKEDEHLLNHEAQQKAFDRIRSVFPLLSSERRRLVELCLKYDFRYKTIGQIMGSSVTYTSNEVKRAIEDIKNIIHQGSNLETKPKPLVAVKIQRKMTQEQEKVLQLRTEKEYSFAAIANELNLSQKEVHQEFMTAYKLMQLKHEQQQSA